MFITAGYKPVHSSCTATDVTFTCELIKDKRVIRELDYTLTGAWVMQG